MEWHEWLNIILGIIGIPALVAGSIRKIKDLGWWKTLIIVGIMLSVTALVFSTTSLPEVWFSPKLPKIVITSPFDHGSVFQETDVEGYADKGLSNNQHLYIVVEMGQLWWPGYANAGYSEATKRYDFHIRAFIGQEGDTGKVFTIRAILVDSAIHERFQSWLQQGEWGGISIPEVHQWGEVQICDSISVTRK